MRPGERFLSRAGICAAAELWGWRPHPTQKQWMLDQSPVKVAACGRRWGKTEAQAVDAASHALLCPGSEQIIVAPTYDQARLIAATVERLLLKRSETRRFTSVRRTPYTQITLGASVISARSADDDGRGLRGHRADRVIVDEAAYVREEVVQEVVRPMLADTGGQLILISTPAGRNWFWRMWVAGQTGSPAIHSFRFPSSSNPHISARYLSDQKEVVPERAWRAEYEAEFIEDASSVFPAADLRRCQSIEVPAPVAGQARVLVGIDWARYTDYTVLVALETGRSPYRLVAMDRFQGSSWRASVDRAAGFLKNCGATAALCDQTGLGDPLLEMLRSHPDCAEVEVDGMVFTPGFKRDLIDNLAIRLAHSEIALPDGNISGSAVLMQELEFFEYRRSGADHLSYNAPSGMHDDCVIALALAAWLARSSPDLRILAV